MRLFLASTSPARLATLNAAGIEPIAIAPGVDEEAAVAEREQRDGPLAPADMVQLLARLKAEAVVREVEDALGAMRGGGADDGGVARGAADGSGYPAGPDGAARPAGADGSGDALIFGGDSAFAFGGTIYGKPHLPERARERWLAYRGHNGVGGVGVLHSGHWLIALRDGRVVDAVGEASQAEVHFSGDLSEAEIDAYVATGEPLKVAGAFTIDGRGAAFIDRVVGDPSTVIGLSIPLLRRLASRLGVAWPELWNRA
ncbi:Maf family protein [Schumannella soli]|uniref:Nucleoside triphosphate pyrophosphatase n=1 Tax=Schumannella soli TaxID=2590779 RepID=A0A506XWH8_9MICO|nr:nucleoside triphosphate pyrophosphatase [Schumannella soli]TPW77254.1 septum formation inhibitor Maf [Schumannella soli]